MNLLNLIQSLFLPKVSQESKGVPNFSPLGSFKVDAPINNDALKAAQDLYQKLPTVPLHGITRIYNHWTVGHYGQDFSDYNVAVRYDGQKFHLDIPTSPANNVPGLNDGKTASHTYYRNSNAVGISTDDMAGANENNFGTEPVTVMTLEFLCAANAAVAKKYGIDVSGKSVGGPYAGEPTILTHAEAADRPGNPAQYSAYGPGSTSERWDLASFIAFPAGQHATAATATACGNAIRQRTHLYKQNLG